MIKEFFRMNELITLGVNYYIIKFPCSLDPGPRTPSTTLVWKLVQWISHVIIVLT